MRRMRKGIAGRISRMPGSAIYEPGFGGHKPFPARTSTSRACKRANPHEMGTSGPFASVRKGNPHACEKLKKCPGNRHLHACTLANSKRARKNPLWEARSARGRPGDPSQRCHSPVKSHTATPGVAVTAVGKLAVEAGEQ